MTSPVARRLFLHIGGYDPMTPEASYRRFNRELGRFRSTWSADADTGPLGVTEDDARWTVTARGPDWSTTTEMRLLRWEDVMGRAAERPALRRYGLGSLALLDFVTGGALWGYLRHAWRYALFFLYPFLLLGMFAALAAAVGALAGRMGGGAWVSVPVGLVALAGLSWTARRRLRIDHLLDDWIFARDLIRSPDPTLSARLGRTAAAVADAAGSGRFDELVVLGHSLGAVLAVDVLDRALAARPDLGRTGARVSLVTVGSSIPKVGLHGGATTLRGALGRVGAAENVFWVEYHSISDAMNFYKVDPVVALRAGPKGPLIRAVKFSAMLSKAYFKRIRLNFFRLHNQFVSGNDKRAPYDYFMVVCGPWPAAAVASTRDGATAWIGPDGSLARPSAPEPAAQGVPA